MASFEQHGSKWRVEVKHNGVRQKKTFPTKRLAMEWAVERERQLRGAAAGRMEDWHTVREAFETYSNRVSNKKGGAKWEQSRIVFFLENNPELARKKLVELSSNDLGLWRDRRLAGDSVRKIKAVSNSTVEREMNLLSNIFHTARREWKWIEKSPLSDVRRPPATLPRTQRVDMDAIERVLLALGHVEGDPPDTTSRRVAYAFLFALETGMRAGEIRTLEWPRVHFDGNYVHLPKTKNGAPRDVPLTERAEEILRIMEKAKEEPLDSVFRLTANQIDGNFRKAKLRAGAGEVHFHDTRREALTRMSEVLSVMELSKVSGHKDINILQNVYYAPKVQTLAEKLRGKTA